METPGCTLHSTGDLIYWDSCGEYPAALSLNAPRFLMENGYLVDLPGAQRTDLLPDLRERKPLIQTGWGGGYLASWSPDGAYLAFVVVIYGRHGYPEYEHRLYLAFGDGTQVQQVALLDGFPWYLQWTEDGRTVTLAAGDSDGVVDQTYIVDALTGQVQVTSGPPSPVPPSTTLQGTATAQSNLTLTAAPETQIPPLAPTPLPVLTPVP